jgi:hypothetical protein
MIGLPLYWTDVALGTAGMGIIVKVPIAGGTPTTLASESASPVDIAVDSTSVYWVDANGVVTKAAK